MSASFIPAQSEHGPLCNNRRGAVAATRALVALAVAALSACASAPPTPPSIDPIQVALADPHRPYVRAGQGQPTVVFQSGLGDDKRVWRQVMPELARDQSVIALDRPGRNDLGAATIPRDPCSIAAEQRAMLKAAGVEPPYLLVGHSLGGLYQFVYAKLYPEEVAGLVLVDATPPYHWDRMQQEAPHAATLLKVVRAIGFRAVDREEFDAQQDCLDRLDLGASLTLPARVLVAGRFRSEEKGDFEAMLKRSRQRWVQLTGAPKLQVIWDSGHYIQKESPEEVVEAVRELTMATSARREQKPTRPASSPPVASTGPEGGVHVSP